MRNINLLFIILCLFVHFKVSSQIIVVHDPIIPDTIDIDEAAESDSIYEDEDTVIIKSGCPGCPGTSHCKVPKSKKLANKIIKFKKSAHYSTPLTSAIRRFKSAPSFRVLRFNALFHKSCIYTGLYSQSSWNKLMKIHSRQCHFVGFGGKQYYLVLGWRYRPDIIPPGESNPGAIELGLYSHIDHRDESPCDDDEKGRESISLKKYISKGALEQGGSGFYIGWPVELVFYNKGFFVRAGERGVAIRRDFTKETCPLCEPATTKMRKSGFFGGTEETPHKMEILVSDIYADYEPTWWDETTYKGFSRSEWYDGETQTIAASEKIEINLPITYPSSANLLDGQSFINFYSGCNITFVTDDFESIPDGLGVNCEVGAEYEHIPYYPGAVNTGEVFTYTCPDQSKMLTCEGNSDTTDTTNYLPKEKPKADSFKEIFECNPNPFNNSTQIIFSIQETTNVRLYITNIYGTEILELVDNELSKGIHNINIKSSALCSGIYYCILETKDRRSHIKLVKL
jgi:hypothetical protein